ncbi:GNAT family N-acetyltransferase [Pseudoduganella aquatica]|uniref:Uncharacterized protein n=1 Tax=Pseudoduganella aquatica TaxID=2660641 RepID=A0A7X4H7P0_9BURK|nr:GNAT family N-acetyltransferase [Pseudoduganella aquatica]MYN06225.1 hypothetical protein [Pseudoduganella aquatica]
MANRDPICARYFNQADISITWDSSIGSEQLEWDAVTIAKLTGAPDGSNILIRRGVGSVDCFVLTVKNDAIFKYPSEYILFGESPAGRPQLLMESIYVRPELRRMGVGVRSAMISLLAAKMLDFATVKLLAAGSAANRRMFVGYHVWPQLGFDAPLPVENSRALPPSLAGAVCLSDLMVSEEGRRWWYDHGSAIEVEFELADGSASWKLFSCYAKRKGVCL